MPLFKKRSEPAVPRPAARPPATAPTPVSLGFARSEGVYCTMGESGPHYIRLLSDGTLLTVWTEQPPAVVRNWQPQATGWVRGRFSFTGDTGAGSTSVDGGKVDYSFTPRPDGSMQVTWTSSLNGKSATRDYVFVPTQGEVPANLPAGSGSASPAAGPSGALANWQPGAELASAVEGALLYAAACLEVIKRLSAAGEEASTAVRARNKAAEPQHPISRESFENFAQQADRKFVPLYKAFEESCSTARDIAAAFRGTVPSSDAVERVLHDAVDAETYSKTEAAGHLLRTTFRPTSAAFIAGIEAANEAIKADIYFFGDDGFIPHVYSPPVADQIACPWCAETIKAAAKICRFCNREVALPQNST